MKEKEVKFKEYPVIVGVLIEDSIEYPIVENIWMAEKDAEVLLEWGDLDHTIYKPKSLVL